MLHNARKKILIVDDSEFDCRLLSMMLHEKEEFDVIEARSGERCLSIVSEEKVDLILMDILMPGMFGTQILKVIREKFNPIELPIIMITAKSDAMDIVGSLQSGANDYITKPVNFEIALSRMRVHLQLAEVSREMGRLREFVAIHAMVATYNHEINNPLTIAMGNLQKLLAQNSNDDTLKKLEVSLQRIADIVKKIQEIDESSKIQYESYVDDLDMVKVK